MKKNILYAAMMGIALAFTACSSEGEDVGAPTTPTLNSASLTNEALSLVFNNVEAPFEEIIFSETGKAIIGPIRAAFPESSRRLASSNAGEYIVGTYTTANNTYTVMVDGSEYCTLEVASKTGTNTTVKIRLHGETDMSEYEAGIAQKVAADEATKTLCREWTVATTRLRHKNGVTAVKQFEDPAEAASLNAILEYAKTVASIDENFDDDMVITSIEFTANGSFCIFFKNGKHYIGKWSWVNSGDGSLKYIWNDANMGNKFENGQATFDVRQYKKVSYYTLTLGAEIVNKNKTYNVELSFYLKEK
ncbi:MAG: hypothetical protein IJP82_04145 [Bacteroidaceae bacterium]|nr:hypothetical protein [Bacteroidaceae bacterium]